MPHFRKTALIEARLFDPENDYSMALDVMKWAGMRWVDPSRNLDAIVPTLEDGVPTYQVKHYATPGDWIAKNSTGEFYPIKPQVMADTYQQVICDNHAT